MGPKVYLAIDLGAESGRVVAGVFDGAGLRLEEVHRFANTPIRDEDGLHWNIDELFYETKAGIKQAVDRYGDRIVSIGVDSWAIDYGLLDRQDALLGRPFCYRDDRYLGMLEKVSGIVGKDRLYDTTGIQFLPFNTIYQLVAEQAREQSILDRAETLLFIPDLINFWLTGRKVNERTNASTGQFYDPREKTWATSLLNELDLPTGILCEIGDPGARLGPLLREIREETGAGPIEVVLPGTHDTASAVAAVPAHGADWAFLSSGTWSLLGVEVTDPVITPKARELELANEIGVCDTVRLLKNTSGMWPVQQCRNTWEALGEPHTYAELTEMAASAEPFATVIDPDDPSFFAPGDMPERIAEYCRQTGQAPPESKGAFIRTVLESLAFRYRWIVTGLAAAAGRSVKTLHVVGGGSQNDLLNQFTANSLNRRVMAGPVEATAAGNILMQLLAMGAIDSLEEGRALVRDSFELTTFEPEDTKPWDAAYERFLEITRIG